MESLIEKTNIARQKGRYWRKIRNIVFLLLLFGFFVWGYFKYYFPVEEGVETGIIYQIVPKGLVFKTYEGKLIRSDEIISKEGEILSDEFNFTITRKKFTGKMFEEKLKHTGGNKVELHYKKYLGAIPWRGHSRYIVDDIIKIYEEKPAYEIDNTAMIF